MKILVLLGGAMPVVCILSLAVFAGAAGQSIKDAASSSAAMCLTSGPVSGLDSIQAPNARAIVSATQQVVANADGDAAAQSDAELIALMTAATESDLHNYANPTVAASELVPNDGDPPSGGDHDSVGLFQQRANWGPLTDRMNAMASTRLFVDRLLRVSGWQSTPPAVDAQTVQVSAFPDRYAEHEAAARAWLSEIQGASTPGGTGTQSTMASCDADDLPLTAVSEIRAGTIPAGYTIPTTATDPERIAVTFALAQLGKPYVFGAAGPNAYDCSGLTMAAWAAAGVELPHYTVSQWHAGTAVPAVSLLSPGDLVLIPGSDGSLDPPNPHHVGMYLGQGYVVEAPQTGDVVKIVPLRSFGPIIGMRDIA